MNPLKIIPLGGLGEIGMNCMVLETEREILLVDCGLLFSDLDHFGVEFIIPDFSYLRERADKIKGFLITHGHEDHIGALPFALKAGLRAPVYASPFASLLIRERLREYGLESSTQIRTFKMGDVLRFGDFKVETVSVNHSIVDSAALIITTPVGKIIHTGDFKIDPTPFYGQALDERVFRKAGDEGVLLLMSDSTNVERHEHSHSESIIQQKFEQIFAAAEGLTVVSQFASNVGRMGQVFELAKKMGKRVVLSGRSMEQNVRLGMEVGYLQGADRLIVPMDEIDQWDRNEIIVLSTGSQGEYRSALIRMAQGEHSHIKLQPGDLVLMSSKFIPGNEKAIGKMINNLFKQGAEVLYEAVHDIHVSGHATKPELKKMLEWTRPRFFMPIHGEYRHLVHHTDLAEDMGMSNERIVLAVNNDVLELTPERFGIVDHLEDNRILIEGREGNDISKLVLKERRQMGETGIVFSLLVRNAESLQIIAGPEIITRGLAQAEVEADLLAQARKVVLKILKGAEAARGQTDIQETIRVDLRRFFHQKMGKKPVVMPIILDL